MHANPSAMNSLETKKRSDWLPAILVTSKTGDPALSDARA